MTDKELLLLTRDRLDQIAADIPNRAAIGRRVAALTPAERLPRPLAGAAVLILVVLGGLLLLATAGGEKSDLIEVAVVDSTASQPGEPAVPEGQPFTSTQFGEPLDFVLPDLSRGSWQLQAETRTEITLLLASSGGLLENDPVLRLMVVPDVDSAEVVRHLVDGLFDTDVLVTGTAFIDGSLGTEVVLASRLGTNHAAFRLSPGTYVETIGVDRRHMIQIVDRPSGSFIFWIDADDDDFVQAQAEANRLASTIDFG